MLSILIEAFVFSIGFFFICWVVAENIDKAREKIVEKLKR